MWELYAFWAFVPVLLVAYGAERLPLSVSVLAFLIIAVGGLGCVFGGLTSERFGVARTARTALLISGTCCLLIGLVVELPPAIFIGLLLVWGITVVADSPLFSTLVARNAPATATGTALTLVNCLGFSITIVSIQLLTWWWAATASPWIFAVLAVGPLFGLWNTRRMLT